MHFVLPIALLLGLSANAPAHKFYVSYGRMAVEGSVAVCRVRYFQDDLQLALRWFSQDKSFELQPTASADALFLQYIEDRLRLVEDGRQLTASVLASGDERDMWWYMVQFDGEEVIDRLEVTNKTLFDLLPDQRNIMKVSHFPSEKERTLYFVEGSDTYTLDFGP